MLCYKYQLLRPVLLRPVLLRPVLLRPMLLRPVLKCSRPLIQNSLSTSGECPGFLKGGGGPISLGSLKKGHQILKGGVQWSEGGGPVNLSHYDDKSCIFRC